MTGSAIGTNWALVAATAAVERVSVRGDTRRTTGRERCRAIRRANPERANLARSTGKVTRPTIQRIALGAGTSAVAARSRVDTIALPSLAGRASATTNAAAATIRCIGLDIYTGATAQIGSGWASALPGRADPPGRTGVAAPAAVCAAGLHVDTDAAAAGVSCNADAGTADATGVGAALIAASAAVARIARSIHTGAVANIWRRSATDQPASAILTNLTIRTCAAAGAAVAWVSCKINTTPSAEPGFGTGTACAFATTASLAAEASHSATTAIEHIGRDIGTSAVADSLICRTGEDAHTLRTHLARSANVAASSAIGEVR